MHFSQFYAMPVILNPSLTGHIPGQYRLNGIYRSQWSNLNKSDGALFTTIGASFDMNFRKSTSNNSFGLGIALANDNSGIGALKTSEVSLSGAYHLSLGQEAKNYLSFGLQGTYLGKRIDPAEITFADQIDPNTGVVSPITSEPISDTNIGNFDIRAGATFAGYPNNKITYMIGVAFMHLTKPEETFLGDTSNKLPNRLAIHGQAAIALAQRFSLRPHVLFMTQEEASELNLGATIGYYAPSNINMHLGAGFRNEGALIFLAGVGIKGVNIGFAYDNDISDLNSNGAYEITLGYVGSIFKPVEPVLPCIRLY